jgi:hypothetical protein
LCHIATGKLSMIDACLRKEFNGTSYRLAQGGPVYLMIGVE